MVLAAVALVAAAGCSVPERLTVPTAGAEQLIVVTSPSWTSTSGSLTTYERSGGSWKAVHVGLAVRLGRNGFNADHREGDGTTPAGSFPIVGVMGGQPDPGVRYPYRRLAPGDCWISDARSPAYNQWVTLTPCTSPNEDLYKIGAGAYRYAAITGYNTAPIVPGAGSAIFLHRHSYDASGRTLRDERLRVHGRAGPARRPALARSGQAPASSRWVRSPGWSDPAESRNPFARAAQLAMRRSSSGEGWVKKASSLWRA